MDTQFTSMWKKMLLHMVLVRSYTRHSRMDTGIYWMMYSQYILSYTA